jgi:hypothetical protein
LNAVLLAVDYIEKIGESRWKKPLKRPKIRFQDGGDDYNGDRRNGGMVFPSRFLSRHKSLAGAVPWSFGTGGTVPTGDSLTFLY